MKILAVRKIDDRFVELRLEGPEYRPFSVVIYVRDAEWSSLDTCPAVYSLSKLDIGWTRVADEVRES